MTSSWHTCPSCQREAKPDKNGVRREIMFRARVRQQLCFLHWLAYHPTM